MKTTRDGRVIQPRIRINKYIITLIRDIKEHHHFTWQDLANHLKVSRDTARIAWIKEGNTIAKTHFRKLISFHPKLTYTHINQHMEYVEPFWGQHKGTRKTTAITLPDLNTTDFAEF